MWKVKEWKERENSGGKIMRKRKYKEKERYREGERGKKMNI